MTPERQRYRPGSREDFDRLYRDSHSRVLASLIAMLGDRAAAEDCAQEAFAQAFRNWARWRPEAPAEAWIHRIAVNQALSLRRREKIRQVGELVRRLGRPGAGPDPADVWRGELLDALRRLPPRQSAAVVLRHFHGYTNREIGYALGIPERTVASRLAAGLARLRREMGTGAEPGVSSSADDISRTERINP
ncbi:MAG: RNA polymerase sigma factor [Candidatus Dormibacteria bacterium]